MFLNDSWTKIRAITECLQFIIKLFTTCNNNAYQFFCCYKLTLIDLLLLQVLNLLKKKKLNRQSHQKLYLVQETKWWVKETGSFPEATSTPNILGGGGSRLTKTKGKQLRDSMSDDSLTHYATGRLTYWPTDILKISDLIKFVLRKV